ncbi:MAG: phage tail tape measure protein [Candidatus Aminicenantes bacterium]|nr:phage tail tape measure protein [Candidatus Aminicenantes bacterium]
MLKPALKIPIIILLCLGLILPAGAQLNKLKDKIKIPVKAPQVPDLDKLLKEEPPVSTTLTDAVYDIQFLDAYNPKQGAFMTFLPVTAQGSFPLLPGLWEGRFQSYCLKAGTYAPGEGDGYAYAPLKGKQAEIVSNILKNSVFHPEINQQDIQLLLWAIIARSKLSECSQEIQKTAKALMTPKEYDRLNGGALGKIPQPVLKAAMQKLPPLARDVFQAETRLREMFLSPVLAPYHEVESVAVRVGEVLPPPDSRDIAWGRWSYDPDGYFIRYFPYGYRATRTQIYYPENFILATDESGLITTIVDRQGTGVQIIYDQNIAPLFFGGDNQVVGLAFKELILTWSGPDGATSTRSIKDSGWVLAGIPVGGGKPDSTAGPRFADAAERYKFALHHRDEVLDMKNKLAKINPELKTLPDSAAWSVIFLGNYCEAIRQAILATARVPVNQIDDMDAEFLRLPYRTWMKGLALLANGELEGETAVNNKEEEYPPSPQEKWVSGPNGEPRHPFFSFPTSGIFSGRVENNSSDNDINMKTPGQPRLTYRRELPKFVWVRREAPKWEKPTRPKKLGPSGLPLFEPDKKVAQPGNTGKQRLGQSGRKTGSGNGREAAKNTRKMIDWFSRGTSAGSFAIGKVVGPGAATPYGIPKAVAGYTIGRTVGLWGECIDAISLDPPRSDFTILARPKPGTFTPVQPGSGVTKARAEAINGLMAAAVDLTAKLRAARFSVERYSGAMMAGDLEWARRQLENAIRYEREAGLSMLTVAGKLETLLKVVQTEGLPDTRLTPELIESYRQSLRQTGFSPEELEACRALNLTAEEIEEMKAAILSDEPLEGPASLYDSTKELAAALREFAQMLLALPAT